MKNISALWYLLAVLLGSVIGSAALLYLSLSAIGSYAHADIIASIYSLSSNYDQTVDMNDAYNLYLLQQKGLIVTNEGLLSGVIGHYSQIISYLLGIIALVGLATFFIVKSSYKIEIENAVNDHMESENLKNFLIIEVQSQIKDIFQEKLALYRDELKYEILDSMSVDTDKVRDLQIEQALQSKELAGISSRLEQVQENMPASGNIVTSGVNVTVPGEAQIKASTSQVNKPNVVPKEGKKNKLSRPSRPSKAKKAEET